jgi:hypothetical protein
MVLDKYRVISKVTCFLKRIKVIKIVLELIMVMVTVVQVCLLRE